MSFKKSVTPLNIDLLPSKLLLIALLLMHVGAAVLTILCMVQWYVAVLLLILLSGSFLLNLCMLGWVRCENPWLVRWQSVNNLTWLGDNSWKLFVQQGEPIEAQLLGTSTCLSYFVALNFKTEGNYGLYRYRSVIIVPDAIDKELFRQLRVRLRIRPIGGLDS